MRWKDTYAYLSDGVSINSPGYPEKYPAGQSCSWNLTVPIGFKIKIEPFVHDIEYPDGMDCSNDYLTFFDGGDKRSEQLAHLCGDDEYAGDASTGRNLFIAFESDGGPNDLGGFQFKVSMIGMKRIWILFWHLTW